MHDKLNEMNDDRSVPLGDRYDTLETQRISTVELEVSWPLKPVMRG
jgi:hypothetical protein